MNNEELSFLKLRKMDENEQKLQDVEPAFQRRQAVRRKGFVWQKTQVITVVYIFLIKSLF